MSSPTQEPTLPAGEPVGDGVEEAVRAFLTEAGIEFEPGARRGELVVQLPGEAKLRTTVSLLLRDKALSASAFVIRRPDENHEAFYRWLLTRNSRLPGIAFALDRLGDVYLVGRIPLAGLGEGPAGEPGTQRLADALDDLLGALLATSDASFNELLTLGFLSSMKKEWAWRVERGESTRNLEAFRHLLQSPGDSGTAGSPAAGDAP